MYRRMYTLKKKRKNGFTLLEVLVFSALSSLVFVAITRVGVMSIKNAKLAEHTVIATHAAEELQEWVRGEKEEEWNVFLAKAALTPGLTYCVNTIPASITDLVSSTGCGTSYTLLNIFKRDLTLTRNVAGTQVTVAITVSWFEGNNVETVPIRTVFSVWE